MEELEKCMTTRGVDELGRIALPAAYRKILDISPGDRVDVSIRDNGIFIIKVQPKCCFCRKEESELIKLNEKMVCRKCLENLNELAK